MSVLADGGARDVRLRVAGKYSAREEADTLAREVNALYCCCPAGGGGVRSAVRRRLETRSAYIDRNLVNATHEVLA